MNRDILNPYAVALIWILSALIAIGFVKLVNLMITIVAEIGVALASVNWASVVNISGGIFICLILSVALYNAYQKAIIMKKHRSILDDVDSDFNLKKEAYAEFLQEDSNGLTPDEELEELDDEYEDKRLSLNKGDKR